MQCRYNQHPAPFSSARRPIFLRIASIRRTLQIAQAFALIARCNAMQINQPERLLENEKRIMPHTVVPATSNRTMHTVPQQPPLRWFVLYFNPDTRCNAMWAYVQPPPSGGSFFISFQIHGATQCGHMYSRHPQVARSLFQLQYVVQRHGSIRAPDQGR